MTDRNTIDVYDRRAADYAEMTRREKPNPALASFMELVVEGGRVLDLGCGPGASAEVLIGNGFRVDAVDASPGMVALARERIGDAVRLATFDDACEPAAYDGIWANFSLLHAPRSAFPGLVARFAGSLKPGGIFHLGMKTGTGEQRDGIGRFYAYYSGAELRETVRQAGLQPLREFTGEGAGLSGEVSPWMEIQARKA